MNEVGSTEKKQKPKKKEKQKQKKKKKKNQKIKKIIREGLEIEFIFPFLPSINDLSAGYFFFFFLVSSLFSSLPWLL